MEWKNDVITHPVNGEKSACSSPVPAPATSPQVCCVIPPTPPQPLSFLFSPHISFPSGIARLLSRLVRAFVSFGASPLALCLTLDLTNSISPPVSQDS